MKVFSKQKMLDRLEKEGRSHMVSEQSIRVMNMLDGQEARKSDFKDLIHDELAYFVRVNSINYPVSLNDCIDK